MATRIRKEVGKLGSNTQKWDPVMLAYARAVALMQTRPATDPTSWDYQAAIHGRLGGARADAVHPQRARSDSGLRWATDRLHALTLCLRRARIGTPQPDPRPDRRLDEGPGHRRTRPDLLASPRQHRPALGALEPE